jgi:hypothetical protein
MMTFSQLIQSTAYDLLTKNINKDVPAFKLKDRPKINITFDWSH